MGGNSIPHFHFAITPNTSPVQDRIFWLAQWEEVGCTVLL